jgi:hypothetical protein
VSCDEVDRRFVGELAESLVSMCLRFMLFSLTGIVKSIKHEISLFLWQLLTFFGERLVFAVISLPVE